MTDAAILLIYAACMGTAGAQLLRRGRWMGRAPLLGIVTYLAAGWSVLGAVGLAGLTLAVHATALGGELSQLTGACVHRLRDLYATPGGATAADLGLIAAGAMAVRTMLAAAGHLRADGRQSLRHARTARLAGHLEPALGAVVLEHPQPASYCVAGRCPTVVVTTGAMAALNPGQLSAVLAHEQAHLAGRHHALKAAARIGHRVLPFLPLLRDAQDQVARLAELHADDAAIRAADPGSLASALVVLATPAPVPPAPDIQQPEASVPPGHRAGVPRPAVAVQDAQAAPGPALAAAATDTVQRIHRLLRPAEPLGLPRRRLMRAAAAALALAPVLVALAPAAAALALGPLPAG